METGLTLTERVREIAPAEIPGRPTPASRQTPAASLAAGRCWQERPATAAA